ncbi:MAG: hypothetical protein WA130_09110 [Candidatus Methanoperedens sp.]
MIFKSLTYGASGHVIWDTTDIFYIKGRAIAAEMNITDMRMNSLDN